jgi:hypothetical protein
MLSELGFDLRLELLRRRERRALVRLGAAAADVDLPRDPHVRELIELITAANLRMAELRKAIASSLQDDRTDYPAVSPLVRPVVVLRGLCVRAILRHQMAAIVRRLLPTRERLAKALLQNEEGRTRLPAPLAGAVLSIRRDLDTISAERADRLAPFGGSTLPKWFPHLGSEARELGRSLWLQLRPNVWPRLPAVIGLAVGWWVADTYTSSHLKSVLHSLGIGNGGRRVVSGDTYRSMIFWLPILAAGLCAYLADRAKLLIQRRYIPEAKRPSI